MATPQQPQFGYSQYPGQQAQPQYGQPPQSAQYGQQPQYAQQQPQYSQQPMYAQPPQYGGQVQYVQQPGMVGGGVMLSSPNANMMMAPNPMMTMTGMGTAPVSLAPPAAPPGTPPGLEYFAVLDHIWVKELPQMLEDVSSVELNQMYQCLTGQGIQVYWAQENTECCTRQCCCAHRPFTINIQDPTGKTCMRLSRPVRMNSAWCCCLLPLNCCFLQDMAVHDISGGLLGRVVQRYTLYGSWFDLLDGAGHRLASIRGPYCTSPCFGDVPFEVLVPGGSGPVGSVTKKWGGIVREDFLSNADNVRCSGRTALPVACGALAHSTRHLLTSAALSVALPSSPLCSPWICPSTPRR